MSLTTTQPQNPGRNDPCLCGSGLRFKRCCGITSPDRPPPHGLVVHEGFLSPSECQALVAQLEQRESERLKVIDSEKTTRDSIVRKIDDTRVTERVEASALQPTLDSLIQRVIEEFVQPETGKNIDWFEQPQVLKYNPGGFYAYHADSENYDSLQQGWVRVADRDVSVLIYLNGDFEGGEILFDTFHYRLKPKPGMLVYFPSDHRYAHTAQQVKSGKRYAIVSWMSAKGVEKLRPPPEHAIVIQTPSQ